MPAVPLEAAPPAAPAAPDPVALLPSGDDLLQPAARRVTAPRWRLRSCTLDLSRARTHDAALDILKVYKLSGNFHGNLDAVLKDMGVCDMVTYRIEPGRTLAFPDCRHVVFRLNDDVPDEMLDGIAASIKARIGFATPWWGGLLRL
jgi:hypothetical protein